MLFNQWPRWVHMYAFFEEYGGAKAPTALLVKWDQR